MFIQLLVKSLSFKNKLPILIYHQVLPDDDVMRPFEINKTQFDLQMEVIRKYFRPVTLYDGVMAAKAGRLTPGSIAVTFDDGYENNYSVALPILQKYQIPATFFVASDFLDGGIMWNDAILETFRQAPLGELDLGGLELGRHWINSDADRFPAALNVLTQLKHLPFEVRGKKVTEVTKGVQLPSDLMMSSEQVRQLSSAGMEIGGHTLTHPILTKVSIEEARRQITENKQTLEQILGENIRCFAYPNGKPGLDYDITVRSLVEKANYALAVSTSAGAGSQSCNPFEFPRYTPWRRNRVGFLVQLISNYFTKPSYA
ncbi:MAG: polysaccharide deacetylase family protein [Hahellaceae bacterium]|nr:polysaccharide deacetylase family protein [Hahellaceae bacterium]